MFDRMKRGWSRLGKRRAGWLLAGAILVASGLTVSARTWLSRSATIHRSVNAPVAQQNSMSAQERAVIRLLTSGFSQAEVSGPAGQYRLVATRSRRDEEVRLQLRRDSGELVEEVVMPPEKVDWTTLIEIQSGSYMLTVNFHPDWVCHITVQ